MRQVFKHEEHEQQYREKGYVIVPFFSADEVKAFQQQYEALPQVEDEGFFSSLFTHNRDYKVKAHEMLAEAGQRVLDEYLVDYEVLIANFVTKKGQDRSLMPPHQDWTFVDEHQHPSINLWWPLTDVSHDNGALYLLERGHHLDFNIRGTLIPSCFNEVNCLTFDELTYLPMKAGEVLLYDHRLIHASPPNTTGKVRVAVAMSTIPKGAQILHFIHNEKTGLVDQYEVDRTFFFDYTYGDNQVPEGNTLVDSFQLENPVFTDDDIAALKTAPPKKGFLQKLWQSLAG